MEVKKGLLWASAGAILMSGLVSAFIFLFGTFGENEAKLILSTFTLGWFGLMASLSLNSEGQFAPLRAGVAIAALGAAVFLHLIWGDVGNLFKENDNEWRVALTLLSLSFVFSWAALLRLHDTIHVAVRSCAWGTAFLVAITEVMMLMVIWERNANFSESFWRGLAALTVLSVTGSFLLPFIRKMTTEKSVPSS